MYQLYGQVLIKKKETKKIKYKNKNKAKKNSNYKKVFGLKNFQGKYVTAKISYRQDCALAVLSTVRIWYHQNCVLRQL